MENAGELPPRPAQKKSFWRLQPSAPTQQSWQTLVQHPKHIELAIIGLSILSLPFTIITSIKYHYFAGGTVSAVITILASLVSLWLYTHSGLSCVTSLIRAVFFCIGWFITTASARWNYYNYSNWDNNDYNNYTNDWATLIRSVFYWGLSVLFFIYLVFAGVALHRERNRRHIQQYRMQPAPGGEHGYGPGPYGPPPPGYPAGGYPAPAGGSYQPPPGPPPDRFA